MKLIKKFTELNKLYSWNNNFSFLLINDKLMKEIIIHTGQSSVVQKIYLNFETIFLS